MFQHLALVTRVQSFSGSARARVRVVPKLLNFSCFGQFEINFGTRTRRQLQIGQLLSHDVTRFCDLRNHIAFCQIGTTSEQLSL
jgi:hypothetical protein